MNAHWCLTHLIPHTWEEAGNAWLEWWNVSLISRLWALHLNDWLMKYSLHSWQKEQLLATQGLSPQCLLTQAFLWFQLLCSCKWLGSQPYLLASLMTATYTNASGNNCNTFPVFSGFVGKMSICPHYKWKDLSWNKGDLVLLKESQAKQNYWPIGIVVKTFPTTMGRSGRLRLWPPLEKHASLAWDQ